jgi:hypothetical protein
VVDRPALAPQQDRDAPIASDTNFRQLTDTLAETDLLGTPVLVEVVDRGRDSLAD